ncbi:podocalyxin [Gadus macrocephalus]|uniref:podocalyxin n=1 Tax=Gadus macrocephalus TaxID=80720 RepID=UPI0028CBA48B|nr:podocalyxin [Gadus macrocephalus]
MGPMTHGNCTVTWSGHGENIKIEDVVDICAAVAVPTANKVWDEIKLEIHPTKPGDKTTLIAILASCGALLAMIIGLGIYATHHRKPYHENQQHLTEELHTVENGYHDNPTLEVMEVQPEMQEKKAPPCNEFNDSWIVPMESMNKEVLLDEEDTHL